MRAEHLELLVEDASTEAFLRALLPRIVGADTTFSVYPHQGKPDLLKKLPSRLRAYSGWLPPTWRLVVVLDRDDDDCHALKQQLEDIARGARLTTRSRSGPSRWQLVNRIAVEELEAWYFGDWPAVMAVYPKVARTVPSRSGFREPDAIAGGSWEAFERLLQRHGYFKTGLRKIEAARAIGHEYDASRSSSTSLCHLRDALLEATSS